MGNTVFEPPNAVQDFLCKFFSQKELNVKYIAQRTKLAGTNTLIKSATISIKLGFICNTFCQELHQFYK
jgi:ribosomal protein S8E